MTFFHIHENKKEFLGLKFQNEKLLNAMRDVNTYLFVRVFVCVGGTHLLEVNESGKKLHTKRA
jgi:hypothetical protein